MSNIAFLLVTCCKEPTRTAILRQVLANLDSEAPGLLHSPGITVFDNDSTEISVAELRVHCTNVCRSDRNVGYGSAIDWWLESLAADPPTYTYIIESDVLHHDFIKLWNCADYLDRHPDVGSVRVHEYRHAERQFYDKDRPIPGSRISAWQSTRNKVNNKPIIVELDEGEIYRTSYLTQLCALNRYATMRDVFLELRQQPTFTELDFQRLYWARYTATGLLEGGIYTAELSTDVQHNAAIGSWTSTEDLKKMGYFPSRVGSIVPTDQYTVTRLT